MNSETEDNFRLSLMGSRITIAELCELRRIARELEIYHPGRLSGWLKRYVRFLGEPTKDFPDISFSKWSGPELVSACDDLANIADEFPGDGSWAGESMDHLREMLIAELCRRVVSGGTDHEPG